MGKPTKATNECVKCKKMFKHPSGLSRHKISCFGLAKPSNCSGCGKTFSRKDSLLLHADKCKGVHEMGCKFCAKTFPTRWRLQRHLKQAHTQKEQFVCSKCSRSYKRKDFFLAHEKNCDGVGSSNYTFDGSDEFPSMVDFPSYLNSTFHEEGEPSTPRATEVRQI